MYVYVYIWYINGMYVYIAQYCVAVRTRPHTMLHIYQVVCLRIVPCNDFKKLHSIFSHNKTIPTYFSGIHHHYHQEIPPLRTEPPLLYVPSAHSL